MALLNHFYYIDVERILYYSFVNTLNITIITITDNNNNNNHSNNNKSSRSVEPKLKKK